MTDRPDPSLQDRTESLARLWRGYSARVYGPPYPLYQAIAAAVADDPEVLDLVLGCPPHAHDPNMLLAAIQYLVLGGADHPLAALYQDDQPGPTATALANVGSLLDGFCRLHRQDLARLMAGHHVQTNETGRAPALALGLAAASERIGEPVALVDAGASAGLNLALDRYLLDFAPNGSMGPPDSPVRLPCRVVGGPIPQPLRLPGISARTGVDREPVDLTDPDAARWMLACIWPGTGRQSRARAAMQMVSEMAPMVHQGDMVTDLPATLARLPSSPVVAVTSWSFSYLPSGARDAFVATLAEEGAKRPVAWVCCDSMEMGSRFGVQPVPAPDGAMASILGLSVFDGARTESQVLAYMHSHGAWIDWRAGTNTTTGTDRA